MIELLFSTWTNRCCAWASALLARTASRVLMATPATSNKAIAAAVASTARCFRANLRRR
ncbi:MAG: hypothetical protein ACLQIB_30835 [Isosphaeraceae bacterium]